MKVAEKVPATLVVTGAGEVINGLPSKVSTTVLGGGAGVKPSPFTVTVTVVPSTALLGLRVIEGAVTVKIALAVLELASVALTV